MKGSLRLKSRESFVYYLQRSNSALTGLKTISQHLNTANNLKAEEKIDNYFKKVSRTLRDKHN